jgi:glycosyltransferase involved in cell wall biosynthesis
MDARIRRAYGKNLNVRIYPVFERFFAKNITKRYDICYVSMATEHKNHVRFFDALGILANRGVSVSALVTVRAAKEKLVEQIKQVNAVGPVKIHNVGEVPTSNVVELYQESRCLVFPSLEESFGLPLIEAAGVGLPVLASDLPYVYEVIQPTMVFDPLSSSSIADCIERFISCGYKVKPAELNVTNSIEKLIEDLV